MFATSACYDPEPIGGNATGASIGAESSGTTGEDSTDVSGAHETQGVDDGSESGRGSSSESSDDGHGGSTDSGAALQPDGAFCESDADCISDRCAPAGLLGSICGECIGDDDCPGGGCTPPNVLVDPPLPSSCNAGELADGCESDAACHGGLVCADVLEIPGVFTARTCSECEADDDCAAGGLCAPTYDLPGNASVKLCVEPGTVADGGNCDLLAGDAACTSGVCAAVDLMGLAQLGVCGECEVDDDCSASHTCVPGTFDLVGGVFTPSTCAVPT